MMIRTEVGAVRSTFLQGKFSENFRDAFRGALQIIGGVLRTEKTGFKLGGCKVKTLVKGGMEKSSKGRGIAPLGLCQMPDWALTEVEAEHGSDPLEGEGLALDDLPEGGFHAGAELLQELPAIDSLHFLELGESRRKGEGIP